MSDKKGENTGNNASDAVELNETELDQVVGAGPVPYPDVGTSSSSGSTKNVTIKDGNSAESSDGNEAGTQKGVVSTSTTGPATPVKSSTNVKFEGKNVTRFI